MKMGSGWCTLVLGQQISSRLSLTIFKRQAQHAGGILLRAPLTSMFFAGPVDQKSARPVNQSMAALWQHSRKLNSPSRRLLRCTFSDADADLLGSSEKRLSALAAPVHPTPGPASMAIPKIVKRLNTSGLHFAFLDPHNLGSLSFDLFESLAELKRIDVIAHVSLSDLQRNADRYTSAAHSEFDRFAPGWRDHIKADMNQSSLRAAIMKYWTEKVMSLGLPRAKHCELFKGPNNQRLYWLIFLSKHALAHKLWVAISSAAKSPAFDF